MHLRPPELQSEDLFSTMTSALEPSAGPHVNDTLDDVFGSVPSSPTLEAANARVGDVAAHPSDMHRLRQEHATAGYRDGVTAAKAESIQAGFDEGFGLGATIGMRAGELLGILEGIASALAHAGHGDSSRAKNLLVEAKDELSTGSLFGPEYWAADGTWKYGVDATTAEDEVVFADIADAHPLIRKWSDVVSKQAEDWHVDRAVMDTRTDGQPGSATGATKEVASPQAQSRAALDW